MSEQLVNLASTTLANNYVAGSGALVVTSATGFPTQGTFSVTIVNSLGVAQLIFRVTSVSGTTFNGMAETLDTNCNAGSNVYASILSVDAIKQLDLDRGRLPFSFGDPTIPSFVWRNQGSATVATRGKSLYLTAPAAANNNIKGYEITTPSTPWSITIGIMPFEWGVNYNNVGLYVTDGTKLVAFSLQYNTGWIITVINYTNATTYSSAPFSITAPVSHYLFFLKIVNDGTNLTFYYSINGTDFYQVYQTTVTAFLATNPTAVGFFAESNNATYPASVGLVSWIQGTN